MSSISRLSISLVLNTMQPFPLSIDPLLSPPSHQHVPVLPAPSFSVSFSPMDLMLYLPSPPCTQFVITSWASPISGLYFRKLFFILQGASWFVRPCCRSLSTVCRLNLCRFGPSALYFGGLLISAPSYYRPSLSPTNDIIRN